MRGVRTIARARQCQPGGGTEVARYHCYGNEERQDGGKSPGRPSAHDNL